MGLLVAPEQTSGCRMVIGCRVIASAHDKATSDCQSGQRSSLPTVIGLSMKMFSTTMRQWGSRIECHDSLTG